MNALRNKLLAALGQATAIAQLDLKDVTVENLLAIQATAVELRVTILDALQYVPKEK